MNKICKAFFILMFLSWTYEGLTQTEEENKKFRIHSISTNIGHHSIGWPGAWRNPLHFNFQIDANWTRNPLKPNRQLTTSIGYTNRPFWSNDIYFHSCFSPQSTFFNGQFHFNWKVGAGIIMNIHQNQIFVFDNGRYKPKSTNTSLRPLIVFGIESGYKVNNKFIIAISYEWRVQIPHGGGLPMLPHSNYNLKLKYKLAK